MQKVQERKHSQYGFPVRPEDMKRDFGLFNVFKFIPEKDISTPSPSDHRKDYYKISLVEGSGTFSYADEEIIIENNSIVSLDPQVPHGALQNENIRGVHVCVFDQAFFHQYKNVSRYAIFKPGHNVFELSNEQFLELKDIYQRMLEEIEGDYIHKYDLLRALVYELVLYTIKMKPASKLSQQPINASDRIALRFAELLERQFPIDDVSRPLSPRSASDYAENLNIHVNHLNRALKETSDKTTSQLIIERILQEAKALLKQTSWTVSEVAYALGYSEVTHFNNIFKKYMETTPTDFRSTNIV